MHAVLPRFLVGLSLISAGMLASAEAGEKVVLRAGSGRFLRAAEDGTVRADRLFPTKKETFELLPCQSGHVALKAGNGRFLVAEGRDARSLRADSPRIEPDDRETFVLAPLGENRTAMKARNHRDFIVFDHHGPKTSEPTPPERPKPEEIVEIYRAGQIPPVIRTGLAVAIRTLVVAELAGKQYDKVDSRKKVKFIELPAPTLRDPGRKKKHQVLGIREEYHVKARLDGPPEIRIEEMPSLKGHFDGESGLLMFVVRAGVPVRGRVRYRIPDALSASTGFRTTVGLAMVGQLRVEKSDDEVSFSPPELLDFGVELRGLELSNDLLHAARRPIEDLINHELRKREDRIRQQANKSLHKAVQTREFRHPLLRYL